MSYNPAIIIFHSSNLNENEIESFQEQEERLEQEMIEESYAQEEDSNVENRIIELFCKLSKKDKELVLGLLYEILREDNSITVDRQKRKCKY